jgi:serine/threonine protein phosphatase PrpC
MKFTIYQTSRIGGRKYNQDRIAHSYSREALLMVLADGMGGHLHGEVAAQFAVQLISETFEKHANPKLKEPQTFLKSAFHNAHEAIMSYASNHNLLDTPRTTCVACIVQDDTAYWAHAGDSRLYFFRGSKLVMRTRDHSRLQQMLDNGSISLKQAANCPERNKIYNCLGGLLPPEVEMSKKTPLRYGDTFLLCSDGLWNSLPDDEILAVISGYPVIQAVQHLMIQAEAREGEHSDNLSAIGMTWSGEAREAPAPEVSTQTMPLNTFTTQMSGFDSGHDAPAVTDEEIEQAIAEIKETIENYSK